MLFETKNGRLLAMIDASEVTAIRTAAVSAVATKLLAKHDASVLAILGSGTQAKMHLESIQKVRSIAKAKVWSRNPGHAKQFVSRESKKWNLSIQAAASAREAIRDADIICTATSANTPILLGEWLEPGVHINAVGAPRPTSREMDSEAIAMSKVFVDSRESAINESGDIIAPIKEGKITEKHILGELGELVLGKIEGRTSEADTTLFKSLGLAVEDLASAHYIYSKANAHRTGNWVEFSGERSD
jgi:ornithine cyclodeaminase